MLPLGTDVQFHSFSASQVEMKLPARAVVHLQGEVTEHDGQGELITWEVPMRFDPQGREWIGESSKGDTP